MPFDAATDQSTGHSTKPRVVIRDHSTGNATQQSATCMPRLRLHSLDVFNRTILQRNRTTGQPC